MHRVHRIGLSAGGAALAALSIVSSHAAAQVTPQNPSGSVKGGVQQISSPEGLSAKISLFGLKAKIFPPLAGDSKSRLAYVDGRAESTLLAVGGQQIDSAVIEVGYVVACGVKDGGFESWIGSNQSIGGHLDTTVGAGAAGALGGPIPAGAIAAGGTINPGISGQLGLSQNQVIKTSPGEIKYIPVGAKTISKPQSAETFGVRFGEKRISVEGCIGSVDAVAYATANYSSRAFDNAKTVYSEVICLA